MTYGQIASYCDHPGLARQVSWFLHSSSKKNKLPWQRVINSQGRISLKGELGSLQKRLLVKEGIIFTSEMSLSLKKYQWHPKVV